MLDHLNNRHRLLGVGVEAGEEVVDSGSDSEVVVCSGSEVEGAR